MTTAAPVSTTPEFRPVPAALLCAALVMLAASTGVFAEPGAWYASINHPVGTPPNFLFPIGWSVFYTLMAVAAWRILKVAGFGKAFVFFVVQLALNALWTPMAFGVKSLTGALVVVIALWLAVAATAVVFRRTDRLAGALFLPYLGWVSFALYLNIGLVILN
ncbi:TspO/MBR family protein [Salinisphaera sp. Q1T1-3]|uniref:TspO/MBR family protein n=1 Tax=Salinisphaera sp. Q1T1-3 TaxID=2321229 RepID=UPI000E75690F|nr:TspO/MBR family protein [Salinisphaera sp. Q1T1-3]RJS90955.1 tryptophan-rich sensory protein [Salinisphaera sp. Q1T1-3]